MTTVIGKISRLRKEGMAEKPMWLKYKICCVPLNGNLKSCSSRMKKNNFFMKIGNWIIEGNLLSGMFLMSPGRFVLRVRPNMIDKVKKRDDLIEMRLQEIENYLERNCYRRRLSKLLHGNEWHWWKYENVKEKYEWRNKSLKQILDIVNEKSS